VSNLSLSELNAKATGLSENIANDPDAIITDEVIAAAAMLTVFESFHIQHPAKSAIWHGIV